MSKKITSFNSLSTNQKFMIVSNSNHHDYPLNTVLTYKKSITAGKELQNIAIEVSSSKYVNIVDIRLVENHIDEITDKLTKIKQSEEQLLDILAFYNRYNITACDSSVITIHNTILSFVPGMSDFDKVNQIYNNLKQ